MGCWVAAIFIKLVSSGRLQNGTCNSPLLPSIVGVFLQHLELALRLLLASGVTARVRQAETCLPCGAPLLLLLDLHGHVTTSGTSWIMRHGAQFPLSPFHLSPFPPFPPPPLFFLDFLLLSFQSSLCILDTSSVLDM